MAVRKVAEATAGDEAGPPGIRVGVVPIPVTRVPKKVARLQTPVAFRARARAASGRDLAVPSKSGAPHGQPVDAPK